MNTDLILNNVSKHINLEKHEIAHFTSFLSSQEFERKGIILNAGDLCRNIFFVNQGAIRAYFVNSEGKESTIMFATSDWWVTDMNAYINQTPSSLYLQCIKKSTVIKLSIEGYGKLLSENPKFERFFRVIMQNAYIREQTRTIQHLSLTAEERYNWFISKYPHILAHVSLRQIASYLGITPEFLSVIRAKQAKG